MIDRNWLLINIKSSCEQGDLMLANVKDTVITKFSNMLFFDVNEYLIPINDQLQMIMVPNIWWHNMVTNIYILLWILSSLYLIAIDRLGQIYCMLLQFLMHKKMVFPLQRRFRTRSLASS